MEIQSKSCSTCGNTYSKPINRSLKDWEQSKYCSLSCSYKNKDGAHLTEYRFKKGDNPSPRTQFKKGVKVGAKNVKWKGDQASYTAKHMWVAYHYGKPQECENCGTTEKRMYHWSNISKEYRRDRSDWLRLCVPCHKSNDIKILGGKIKPKTKKIQPTRECAECGEMFVKDSRLSMKQWEKVSYCGRKCGSLVSARKRLGTKQSDETRALKSEKLRERWQNPEWRERISEKMKGNQYAKNKENKL